MKTFERSWIVAEGGRWADGEIFPKLFYIVIVITDACDLFQIQCVNIYWLNSFDNLLLFTHNKCNCFLVIQGFSIRRFCFLRFCYRYIYCSVLKHSNQGFLLPAAPFRLNSRVWETAGSFSACNYHFSDFRIFFTRLDLQENTGGQEKSSLLVRKLIGSNRRVHYEDESCDISTAGL
jgi:hypothetical protein